MKLNKKGFTLIELIAMLVVLGVLMAVTVPNITGILNKSKENILKEDINKMVDNAKVIISTNKDIGNPREDRCVIFHLNYLDTGDDFKTGPHNGTYEKDDSYIIIKRKNNKYIYYVTLLEKKDNKYYGVVNLEYEKIQNNFKKSIKSYSTKQTDKFYIKCEDENIDWES